MNPPEPDPIDQLKDHLASQVVVKARETDFDMDDAPEVTVLSPFDELQGALFWLESKLTQPWRICDREALRCQSRHRRLARVAIGTGTAAIILAILQLSTKLTLLIEPAWPSQLTTGALIFEAVAVVAALVAVGVGIVTKFDRRWLGQRHLAERYRTLKFRALLELCFKDRSAWQLWVEEKIDELKGADQFAVINLWSKGGEIEPRTMPSDSNTPDPVLVKSLTIYYIFKRLDFQANYFRDRRQTYERQTGKWRHLNLPFFLMSALFVLAHFALEFRATGLRIAGSEESARAWEVAGGWCVALAAIIPILGLGIRAWFAAFELPRNASLFAAKHRALLHARRHVEEDFGKVLPALYHIAWAEHFLEHEHREWLRLLLETEWFL